MKKGLLILLCTLLLFILTCQDENDPIETNLLELLKGKVYHKDTANGSRYVHFDLSFLGEDSILGEQYEGWSYYEKHNEDPDEQGCFLDSSISSQMYGLYLTWYTDTIINNPIEFKLEGIYDQYWIVTKDDNGTISITAKWGGVDGGYTEMNLEEFIGLDCM